MTGKTRDVQPIRKGTINISKLIKPEVHEKPMDTELARILRKYAMNDLVIGSAEIVGGVLAIAIPTSIAYIFLRYGNTPRFSSIVSEVGDVSSAIAVASLGVSASIATMQGFGRGTKHIAKFIDWLRD